MINKVKLGINNLYLFENNNGDYLLLRVSYDANS